jgi:hypothetical protein
MALGMASSGIFAVTTAWRHTDHAKTLADYRANPLGKGEKS